MLKRKSAQRGLSIDATFKIKRMKLPPVVFQLSSSSQG